MRKFIILSLILSYSVLVKAETISAVGRGAPPEFAVNKAQVYLMGEYAAKTEGLFNLAAKLYGYEFENNDVLENGSVKSHIISSTNKYRLKNFKFARSKVFNNGIVEVGVDFDKPEINAEKMNDILKDDPVYVKEIADNSYNESENRKIEIVKSIKKELKKSIENKKNERKYTGLILDCSEYRFEFTYNFLIFSQEGEIVFSPMRNSKIKNKYEVAGICNSVDYALKEKKVIGENPLVIKPLKINSGSLLRIILKNKDVTILKNGTEPGVLNEGRILIIKK